MVLTGRGNIEGLVVENLAVVSFEGEVFEGSIDSSTARLAFGLGPVVAACANDSGEARTSMEKARPLAKGYLAKNSPVSPEIEERVTATDLPQTTLTQLPGARGYEFH